MNKFLLIFFLLERIEIASGIIHKSVKIDTCPAYHTIFFEIMSKTENKNIKKERPFSCIVN